MALKYNTKQAYLNATNKFCSRDLSLVSGPLTGRNLTRILDKLKPANMHILDVGCGYGKLILQAKKEFPDNKFTGVDLNPANVSIAKKSASFSDFFVMDIESLHFRSESFDIVFCADTLEHAYNPSAALKELSRVLKKGGFMVLSVPNYFNITGLFKFFFEKSGLYRKKTFNGFRPSPVENENFMTSLKTRKMIRKSGLGIVHAEGIELLGGIIPFFGLNYTYYLLGKKLGRVLRFIFYRFGDLMFYICLAADTLSRKLFPFILISLHTFYICRK